MMLSDIIQVLSLDLDDDELVDEDEIDSSTEESSIDLEDNPLEDISDDEIAETFDQQSQVVAADTPSNGLGFGWPSAPTMKRFVPKLSIIIEDPDEEDVESDIDTSSDGSDFDIEFETDESSSALEDPMEEPLEDVSGQSEIAAIINSPAASNGLGSGYTESGKRYSLRQAKLLQDEEDASTEGFGSGTTEEGRRFSRRVANRGSGSN
jgi:hypothetical protein